jgi:hypothetical protein
MKTQIKTRLALLGFLVTGWIGTNAQTVLESEVPGDNFSLEGALELFKDSSSPEEFERKLNSPDSKVNNLDLNNDHYIDYIRVIDHTEGNVHAFIIQAVLSKSESQDVAVIELEKFQDGRASLQITGDADVYGVETIIEPTEEVRVYAGTTTVRRPVNVWSWPSVRYVYQPYYIVYVSPWYWSYRPYWWSPWRPVAYYVYDPWWRPYRSYYSVCHSHRSGYAYEMYRPHRTTSVIVNNYYGDQINNYRSRTDSGTRGRDRYTSQDGDQRNNSGSRSGSQSRTNSDEGRTFVDNSNFRHESGSADVSRSNERSKEFMKTRPAQTTLSSTDYRESIDHSNPALRRRTENRSQEVTKPSRMAQETSSGTQKSFDRSSADFNRSAPVQRSNSQFGHETVRRTQPASSGQSQNMSRSSMGSGIRTDRPAISRPSGPSQSSPSNRMEKSRVSRGKN